MSTTTCSSLRAPTYVTCSLTLSPRCTPSQGLSHRLSYQVIRRAVQANRPRASSLILPSPPQGVILGLNHPVLKFLGNLHSAFPTWS